MIFKDLKIDERFHFWIERPFGGPKDSSWSINVWTKTIPRTDGTNCRFDTHAQRIRDNQRVTVTDLALLNKKEEM